MSAQTFSVEIADEVNMLRADPPAYAAYVEQFLETFQDDFVYLNNSTGKKIRLKEGKLNVLQTIQELLATEPLEDMSPCAELEEAALDHANDIETSGVTAHSGSDNSTTSDRIKRYGTWGGKIGENIRYGNSNPREIVIAWLVDDNVPSRGHRKNLLHPDFGFIGAALVNHDKYHHCCVATFAHRFD